MSMKIAADIRLGHENRKTSFESAINLIATLAQFGLDIR
jgi:hypothetical protein